MILGIDALLDMGRTCLNMTGDMADAVIVNKSERVLDESRR
jgi:Na+/H+-dicarboxylate symporter